MAVRECGVQMVDDIDHWNKAAARYSATGSPDDFISAQLIPLIWESLGDVSGKRVLDAGCGHGILSASLAQAGALVLGIDGSSELLKRASEHAADVEFIEHDLRIALPELGQFDAVVAHMVVMDVDPLAAMIESVAGCLRPGGKFIYTMTHPGVFGFKTSEDDEGRYRKLRDYLKHSTRWIESFGGHTHYHRPLSYYINLSAQFGLATTRFCEPEHKEHLSVFCCVEATKVV